MSPRPTLRHAGPLVVLLALAAGLGCSFGPKHEDPEELGDTAPGGMDLGIVEPGLDSSTDAAFAADTLVPKTDDAADGTEGGGCGERDGGDAAPCVDGATDTRVEDATDTAPDVASDGLTDAPAEGSAGG